MIKLFNMTAATNQPGRWIPAEAVVETLRVSRTTVYAYASRGLIGVVSDLDNPRRSLYDAHDVARLAERRRLGRSHKAVAASTVSWGTPILQSSITRVHAGGLSYRGVDAVLLSKDASLEETARLLWQCGPAPGVGCPGPDRAALPGSRQDASVSERCARRLASLISAGPWEGRPEATTAAAFQIMREVTAAVGGGTPCNAPVHEQLALTWTGKLDAADAIRRCLVLCADHELNASTYAARVVASTRASLGACALAGLAALTGPLHGGTTDRVRDMLGDKALMAEPARVVGERLARGEALPGFGHPLYPDGDPRARELLSVVGVSQRWRLLLDSMERASGIRPHIDFALVAVERRHALPPGAAFGLFATGRVVGWIAHAMEQWAEGGVIRPRATYTGERLAGEQSSHG